MKPAKMMSGLIVDNFAGGGGASLGIEQAFGRSVDIAINHDAEAIAMHQANHPDTLHLCQSVYKADPVDVVKGRQVALAWFSPDCKHFSKAKGGKPVEKGIRDLAWIVVHWARRLGPALQPRVIMLENVEEFRTWCPIDPETGLPIRRIANNGQLSLLEDPATPRKGRRKKIKLEGETFQLWVAALRKAGYQIEYREIRGCDYGEATIRKRLFVIARCDGQPIVWPNATHGPGLRPYRTAANSVIDWSIPCPSIFDRPKPLAENTLRRIAHGIMKFVVNAANPFIVPVCNSTWQATTTHSINRGLPTITTAKGGEFALVTPFIERQFGKSLGASADLPLPTVTAGGGGKSALVAAFVAKHTGGGIGRSANEPLNAVTANGGINSHPGGATPLGIVCAHLEQANGGPNNDNLAGRAVTAPMSTATATGSQQRLIASHLIKLRGTCRHGQSVSDPAPTLTASGTHVGQVCAFLTKYFGSTVDGQEVNSSLHTVTAKPRFGLVIVTIAGEEWVIVDIGMRMLTRRELARAQGFPDTYDIAPVCWRKTPSGKDVYGPLPVSSSIRMIGNSVNRRVARALVSANCNAGAISTDRMAA